jgi:hypothetical protein
MNLTFQPVDGSANRFEGLTIVRIDHFITLGFEFANPSFDGRFIHADDIVMLVLDSECLGQRNHEPLFIQLGVALDCFVVHALGYFTKIRKSFMSKLFES